MLVLLLILLCHGIIINALPHPRQALSFGGSVFLSNRGFYVPAPVLQPGFWIVAAAFSAAAIGAWMLYRRARRIQAETGTRPAVFGYGILLVCGVTAVAFAAAGGPDIPCAPYATFGTEDLSRHATAALKNRAACLLAHHGLIATGATLDKAMWLAVEVETLANQYLGCLPFGEPPVLSDAEIDRVRDRMKGYGHQG